MKFRRPKGKTLLRWVVIIAVVVILAIYLALPTALGFVSTIPHHTDVGEPPAGFQVLTLTTDDEVEIGAWYVPPQNGAAVILIHGAGGSRKSMRGYTSFLREHGFGVLAIDLRGHGESGGDANLFGWKGTRDVGAAVAYLSTQPEVKTIGGMGISLGAEVLLGAASTYPVIQAIIGDGASFRCTEEYIDLPENSSLMRSFVTRVMYFSVGVFSGDEPPLPLLDSIRAADTTPFLFITAGNDETEVAYNNLFMENAASHASLWIVPDVGHTQGFSHYPDEYKQRVIEFFTSTLLQPES